MDTLPKRPQIGALKSADHVSASAAARLLACPLSFAFDADTDLRRWKPFLAPALLGTAAHVALAALVRCRDSGIVFASNNRTRDVARQTFEEALAEVCRVRDVKIDERGPLSGENVEPPAHLPFYAMTRARVARFAEERFGERWPWTKPTIRPENFQQKGGPQPRRDGGPELPLRSRDGLIRGSADAVNRNGSDIIIEEFKTGEATPERLGAWKHQLLIYAHLYREQFGCSPTILRVQSLRGPAHEFACVDREAANAGQITIRAFSDLNNQIANGAGPEALARPSAEVCVHCSHRVWCEPYWSAFAPGSEGADAEGTIVSVDGWEADLLRPTGDVTRVSFKALRITPRSGVRIRICGARVEADGKLACHRATSVWRVSS